MVDNTTLPGTGDVIATDDIAGVKHQLVKVEWGPADTANQVDTATGKPLPVQVRSATGLIPIGEPTDAKSTATDTTSVSGISIWKQISASIQAAAASLAGTIAVSGTFWQATQPVSAASLPLPTGAATAAKQPALGTAGAASTDVITVQGIASGTAQPVSGTFWQTTQPVSIATAPVLVAGSAIVGKVGIDQTTDGTTNLVAAKQNGTWNVTNISGTISLPTGAATAAKQPAIGTAGSASTDVITVQGIASGTAQPVSIATAPVLVAGSAVIGKVGIDQTTPGTTNLVAVKNRFIAAAGTTLTRPANTTPYSSNDSISDNATAGSVTAQPVTFSDTNDDTVSIERIRVSTNDTGLAAAIGIRVWVYNSDPTASTGVVGGDNAAYSNKKAGFIGTLSGNFRAGHSDGGIAICTPDEGRRIITSPGTGAKTVWLQYQALDAFTPSANSTTLIPTVEGEQGRA